MPRKQIYSQVRKSPEKKLTFLLFCEKGLYFSLYKTDFRITF